MPPLDKILVQHWGTVDGKQVNLYTLKNSHGELVKITNYGGIVTSWMSRDKRGGFGEVVMGFDSLSTYLKGTPYFGAIVGRYANRIANGEFHIGDKVYKLARNNDGNHLHGGLKGFDKVVWDAVLPENESNTLTLTYTSKDMEEGYPGTLQVSVRYTFTDNNELEIEYEATTDKPTVVNLTNHSYFNLSSDFTKTILDHTLHLKASTYTPADSLIPTGAIRPVRNTPFDFTEPRTIGERIEQVEGGGYDLNFVIDQSDSLAPAATVVDSVSGRKLEVFTTEPGIQLYVGIHLDGSLKNAQGIPFRQYGGFCLETQHYPDSPNKPEFPSTLLNPGETFRSRTQYRISLINE